MICFIFSLLLLSLLRQSATFPCSDVPPILCRYFPYCMLKVDKCVLDSCYASVENCTINGADCMKDKTSGVCTLGGRKIDGCTMVRAPFEEKCDFYECDIYYIKSLDVSVCVRKLPSRADLCALNSVNCKFIYFCKEVNGECVEDTCAAVNISDAAVNSSDAAVNSSDAAIDSSDADIDSSDCESIPKCTTVTGANGTDSLCLSDTRVPFDYCMGYISLYGGLNRSDCEAKGCDGLRNMAFNEDYGMTVCVGGESNACNMLGTSLCKHNLSCYVDVNEQKCKVDGCFGAVEVTTDCDNFNGCRKQTFALDDETYEFCSTIDREIDVCTYKGFDSNGECKEGCVKEEKKLEKEGEGKEKPTVITVCVTPPSRAISLSVDISLVGLLLIAFALFN